MDELEDSLERLAQDEKNYEDELKVAIESVERVSRKLVT